MIRGYKAPPAPGFAFYPEGRVPQAPFLIFWISSVRFPASDLGSAFAFRACLETTRGAVFVEKAGWRDATKENIPGGSSTEEQRSQTAFSAKTLRAAGLLSVAGVGSFLTARCGDARNSPPWPQPKSLAAAPLVVSKQALRRDQSWLIFIR